MRSSISGVQVAEVVAEVFGEAGLRKLDGDDQHPDGVGHPVVPVVAAIAGDAVMHEQNGHTGMPVGWPSGMEPEKAIGEGFVVIFERTGSRLGNKRLQVCFDWHSPGSPPVSGWRSCRGLHRNVKADAKCTFR